MKNTFKGWMLAASAMLGVGFTSCQSEISDINNVGNEANKVYVTITASLGDDTRATLSKDGNKLKFGWTSNDETKDKIEVVDASTGNWLGTLDVTKVHDDITKCDFSGQIMAPEGDCTLKFYYLASYTLEKEFKNGVFETKPLSIDFENQNGLEYPLSNSDILIGTKTYENGVNGNLGYVNFDREFTYAQFVLKRNGEELDVRGVEVTIENAKEGSTLHNVATLDYAKGTYSHNDGSIKINVPEDASEEAGKGFFVKFFPQENVELKFTCKIGDDTFIGTRATSTQSLVSNLLYTESGNGSPMIVEMKNADGSDDEKTFVLNYHQNLFTPYNETVTKTGSEESAVYNFKVLSYENVGFKNNPFENEKSDFYTFKGWTTTANNLETKVDIDSDYPLEYNTETQEKTISGNLYAYMTINYKLSFEINNGATGTVDDIKDPQDNASTTTIQLPDGEGVSKQGYKFVGWQERGMTDQLVKPGESWTLHWDRPQIVLVPVWEEVAEPNTVSTSGYGHGTINM